MATCTKPVPITEAMLTSTSAGEPSVGEVAWVAATSYGVGAKVVLGAPSSTVTISVAAPAVVTWATNGLPEGAPVRFTTTGALPTGLSVGTTYYVVNRLAGSFQVSTEAGGLPITTSGTQSGTHTATASIHKSYQGLIASNTGNPPAIDDGSKWLYLGPSNAWALFDLYRKSVSWAASPYSVKVTPKERVGSVFLGGLVADSVTINVWVGGIIVHTEVRNLSTRKSLNYTDFFFKKFRLKTSVQVIDLPLYSSASIEVVATRASGLVGIGEYVVGNPVYLGKTQYGVSIKTRNFTKFDRNFDGTPQAPVRRRNVPTVAPDIVFDKENTSILTDLRDDLNGVVAVWSNLDDEDHPYFEPLLILGIATTFDINLARPNEGVLSAVFEEY